jgi:hypothetical protein
LYSNTHQGVFTFILSHFFFPRRAFPIGDSFDIFGTLNRISDSVVPTILKVSNSFFSHSRILTKAQIFTLFSFFPVSSIREIFLNCSSKSRILFSTCACSFLASSYSEFSERSQNEIASFNFSAISTLFIFFNSYNSLCNLANHSAVIYIKFSLIVFNLKIKMYLKLFL